MKSLGVSLGMEPWISMKAASGSRLLFVEMPFMHMFMMRWGLEFRRSANASKDADVIGL